MGSPRAAVGPPRACACRLGPTAVPQGELECGAVGRLWGPVPARAPSLVPARVSCLVGGLSPGMLVLVNPGQEEAAGPPSPRQRRQTRALGWVSWVSRSHTGAQNGPGSGPAFCPDSAVCVQVRARSRVGALRELPRVRTWVVGGRQWLSGTSLQAGGLTPPPPFLGQVAGLFHDPSIGNPIHITIVRLVLLEDEEVRGHMAAGCPAMGVGRQSPPGPSPEGPRVEGHGGPPWPGRCPPSPPGPRPALHRVPPRMGLWGGVVPGGWTGPLSPAFGGEWGLALRRSGEGPALPSLPPGRPEGHAPRGQHPSQLLQVAKEHQHEGGRAPAAPRHRHPAHQVPPAVGGRDTARGATGWWGGGQRGQRGPALEGGAV